MVLFATIITLLICFFIIYLLVRFFFSSTVTSYKIVRLALLLVIAILISGTLLYLYSRLGIESGTLDNMAILGALLFTLWLQMKKDQSKTRNELLERVIISSCLIIAIMPIFLNVLLK